MLASRCADSLWGLSPHQLNILLHRWPYVTYLNGGLWGMSPHQRTAYDGISWEQHPYFDLSLFGDEWQGRIFDTFSSGPRGDIAETFTSDGPGSSISAHGA